MMMVNGLGQMMILLIVIYLNIFCFFRIHIFKNKLIEITTNKSTRQNKMMMTRQNKMMKEKEAEFQQTIKKIHDWLHIYGVKCFLFLFNDSFCKNGLSRNEYDADCFC